MQAAFTFLISLQFLLIVSHDLLEIPGWTHTSQIRAVLGTGKLWAVTLINAIFPGVAVGLAWCLWNRSRTEFADRYWLIYCAITVFSAIAMWYMPYFLGASEKKKDEYQRFYAGTRQVLPARGDNPRPNLLHVLFHGLFLTTFVLALAMHRRVS